MVYASIWIKGVDSWRSGRGSAGGYGYCKFSQAAFDAINSAGVELFGKEGKRLYLGGTGESVVRKALHKIAESMGYTEILILG